MANETQLEVYRGDLFNRLLTFTRPDGTLANIGGGTVRFMIKRRKSDPDSRALVSLTSTAPNSQGSIDVVDSSTVRIKILPSASSALPADECFYDCDVRFSADDISTAVFGTVSVIQQIVQTP